MSVIKDLKAREILDSRGNPTVEVDLWLANGSFGRASVPSGASTGSHEACELRDGGARYGGQGTRQAVNHVNLEIKNNIIGKELDQASLDELMIGLDGTPNKSRLGANAILGVSMAFSHAAAWERNISLYQYFAQISGSPDPCILPTPMMNILNGGKHAENSTDIQEFMILPIGAKSFHEALRHGAETFHALKSLLKSKGLNTSVGDEGGFAPSLLSNHAAIEMILKAIEKAGYKPGEDIAIGIDVAATEIYKSNKYFFKTENKHFSSDQLNDIYRGWIDKYPILSIEDGLAEDDWSGYKKMTAVLGDKIQIVGDDLFVTNLMRLEQGIQEKVANSILVKVNQIGTITEAIATVQIAKESKYTAVISHRSGETEDTTIADLVVGLGTGQIKTGSLCRTERIAKYNQLLRIEEWLGDKAKYLGGESLLIR